MLPKYRRRVTGYRFGEAVTSPLILIAIKALVGGTAVVAFAAIGEFLRPRGLAGIFAAAPSVAIGSLAVTVIASGASSGANQLTGMVAGAAALTAYCLVGAESVKRFGALKGALTAIAPWFAVAIALWLVVLR
jgi:Protein of unknown function (DUF3147)